MVIGLDRFRAQFADFADRYVLIGGTACQVLMEQSGLDFRATKDLDIVLCVETMDAAFTKRFFEFVKAGGYEQRDRSTGGKEFYRFIKPKDESFPKMLELFSRKPDAITLAPDSYLTPIPVDEEIASLSAILLDDAYYAMLKAGTVVVGGLPVLDAATLIPFKAFAYLNLIKSKNDGGAVDQKNVTKHRNDVFRLLQLLTAGMAIALPEGVKRDLTTFADQIAVDATFLPRDIGLGRTSAADQVARLRDVYGL